MHARKKTEWVLTPLWLSVLCIYWLEIIEINFSQNPFLYCTDMYSDMVYASEVWLQKDLFPDGWVFGNQLYIVATPVLAAIMFGITNNHCIAMGIASTIMGIGVIAAFNWMIKPIFKKFHERLASIAAFMTIVLVSGDAVFDTNGWQLFSRCVRIMLVMRSPRFWPSAVSFADMPLGRQDSVWFWRSLVFCPLEQVSKAFGRQRSWSCR